MWDYTSFFKSYLTKTITQYVQQGKEAPIELTSAAAAIQEAMDILSTNYTQIHQMASNQISSAEQLVERIGQIGSPHSAHSHHSMHNNALIGSTQVCTLTRML